LTAQGLKCVFATSEASWQSRRLLKKTMLNAEQQIPSAHRFSRESGNPEESTGYWMPVFTGMTSPVCFESESGLLQHPAKVVKMVILLEMVELFHLYQVAIICITFKGTSPLLVGWKTSILHA